MARRLARPRVPLLLAVLVLLLAAALALAAVLISMRHPVSAGHPHLAGDEFNRDTFTAPFHVICLSSAAPCPTGRRPETRNLNLNFESPGQLRIWPRFGSLLGSKQQASNDAGDLVLQPFDPVQRWVVTTRLTFPGMPRSLPAPGQVAGLIVYQDPDNFLLLGRLLTAAPSSQLLFLQEVNGVDSFHAVSEPPLGHVTVYLRLRHIGTLYQAEYSYDDKSWTVLVPAASAPSAAGYNAVYAAPQIGLASFGEPDPHVAASTSPADFDWFRVSLLPNSRPASLRLRPHRRPLGVVSASLWYGRVTAGTYNHLDVQGTPPRKLGIWVTIIFPRGSPLTYYAETDSHGAWSQTFPVPKNSITPESSLAVVTVQLWHGKDTTRSFLDFKLTRG